MNNCLLAVICKRQKEVEVKIEFEVQTEFEAVSWMNVIEIEVGFEQRWFNRIQSRGSNCMNKWEFGGGARCKWIPIIPFNP